MRQTPLMDIAALIVAILALAVSLASVRYSQQQAKAATVTAEIESDRRADEVASRADAAQAALVADLTVTIEPGDRNNGGRLVVTNLGPRAAKDVNVTFDAAEDGRPAPITQRWRELSGTLEAGDAVAVNAGISPQTTRRFWVLLEWTDERGQQHKRVRLRP